MLPRSGMVKTLSPREGVPAGRGPGTLSRGKRQTTGGFLMIEARGLV